MTVRSTQLVHQRVTGAVTNQTLYTVPTDRRTIVKEVRFTTNASVAMTAILAVLDGAENVLMQRAAIAAGTTLVFEPWTVLNEGQILRITTTGTGDLDTIISGAELVE